MRDPTATRGSLGLGATASSLTLMCCAIHKPTFLHQRSTHQKRQLVLPSTVSAFGVIHILPFLGRGVVVDGRPIVKVRVEPLLHRPQHRWVQDVLQDYHTADPEGQQGPPQHSCGHSRFTRAHGLWHLWHRDAVACLAV